MRIVQFIKNWTLPISMLTGVAGYFIYVNIPALDSTHAFANTLISYIQPLLIFAMLFVNFCRISPRDLRPHSWMLKPLAVQSLSFVAMGLLIIFLPEMPGRVVIESAMICMICPTATAAAVVTTRLNGNASTVISYTCIINLTASLLIPAIVPFLHDLPNTDLSFEHSFLLIMGKVFPLLILPLLTAWLLKYLAPKVHEKVKQQKDLSFNLWAIALALAIAVTVKAIMHTDESIWNLIGIALASLICCLLQFTIGRHIGKHHGERIAGAQSLGQKNTVFAIWMGYTFMNPVTAMAGGFYSVWHNVVNSYQLYKERKSNSNKV